MDIFLYEDDRAVEKQLRNQCLSYLIENNYESNIYEYSENTDTYETALYMLQLSEKLPAYSRHIRQNNTSNYVVVLLNSNGELIKAVRPGVNPSGYLIRPFERENVHLILDEVFTDYKNYVGSSSDGLFCFKIKSKEYTVPYDKIILFESRNKKTVLRTELQEFEFYETLDDIQKNAPDCFVKIHKSFIVNITKIASVDYGKMYVEFDDGTMAYISRTYKSSLKELMKSR